MIMRHEIPILILLSFTQKLYSVGLIEKPPSIYEWIEENAHICTSIPSENENVLNFLTPDEGRKCSLCPETPPNKIPTSACAVELSPNEVDVEIGCHPVPELCILELRTRFEEFFSGSKTANPGLTSPQEEEIFMAAKSNPFDSNIIASLGRSSNHNPTKAQTIPQSTIFVASTQQPILTTTQIITTTTLPPTTPLVLTTTTTKQPETIPTTVSSPLRHGPQTNQATTHHQFTTISTTDLPEVTDDGLLVVDADSNDESIRSTTIRANVFLPSNGGAPVHIAGRLHEIANHLSVPITTTISPLIGNTTRSHFIRSTAFPSINKEVMPNELPKLNPSKSLFEKRTDNQISTSFQPTSTTKQFTNNSWALFRSAAPQQLTTTPSTSFNTTNKSKEKECEDSNQLCCFWAIAGECDSNPFWMRIHCAKTCGTCGCSLKEADQCVSTGINCTIPTTTTTPLPTTRLTTTQSTTTTTTTEPTTTEPTPPPRFTRFTVKPRNLPRWKTNPLEVNPAAPPAFRPKDDKDGSSVSNQVETSVTTTTARVFISGEYAESDSAVKVSSSSREFVRRPGIQGPTTPSSVENSIESTEDTSISTASISTQSTTSTPANCFNYNRLCQFWADLGECIRNPFWMRPHCQLACQSCGETLNEVFAPKAKPNCANSHTLCPFWAFIGECARNPRWMLKNCAPSCQVC